MKTEQANKQKSAELARLIERAKTGDQAAYAALYEATREHVYRTARAMVRSDEMAQGEGADHLVGENDMHEERIIPLAGKTEGGRAVVTREKPERERSL